MPFFDAMQNTLYYYMLLHAIVMTNMNSLILKIFIVLFTCLILLGSLLAVIDAIDNKPTKEDTVPGLQSSVSPPISHGNMDANVGCDSKNAQDFFDIRAAKVGEYTYTNEAYKVGTIIVDVTEGGPLRYGVQFLDPQTDKSLQDYFNGLTKFIDKCAKNCGIGPVPLHFWYTFPEEGEVEPLKNPFDCEHDDLIENSSTDVENTAHQSAKRITLRHRPLVGSTSLTVARGNSYSMGSIRYILCKYKS
jgi:hypothetical protein